MTDGIDWPSLMRAAWLEARLEPRRFWELTPSELMLMLGRDTGEPFGRTALETLTRAFPDQRSDR